jgi:hypothetical protein
MQLISGKALVLSVSLVSASFALAQGMGGAAPQGGAMGAAPEAGAMGAAPQAGAMGAAPAMPERPAFASVDKNGDGSLSLEEFTQSMPEAMQARAEMAFTRIDADSDGKITEAEYAAATPAGQGR